MSTSLLFDLWDGSAKASSEGTIRIYAGSETNAEPVLCVRKYGDYEWTNISELSASLWMKHRESISSAVLYLGLHDTKLITSMLRTFTPEQRNKWIAENREYDVCANCSCFNPDKKKCIHHDCPGMCSTCFDFKNKPGFENCACCSQKQEMTCPICQDDFTPENLVKSEHCGHQICWACFGRSVKSSRPLSHCPLCRAIFCDKLIDNDIDSDDSDNEFDAMLEAQNGINFDNLFDAIATGAVSVRNTSHRTV